MTFKRISVFPTWADDITTTRSIAGSEQASMIPREYSARVVYHLPGSADASGDSLRCASAHWLTVSFDGGFSISAIWLVSIDIGFIAADPF